jgi:gliding motility-associated-like protein
MFFDQTSDGDWTDEGHWKNNVWNYLGLSTAGGGLGLTSITVNNVNDFNPEPFALAIKKFKVVAGPDVTIVDGQSAQFTPSIGAPTGSTIVWTPDAALSCESCADPAASPNNTTQYKITVTDPAGCTVSDSLIVTVVGNELLVPTGFSPNGDGVNDLFRVLNKNLGKFTLQVFNRWGELVYETTDPTVGWDGNYKNEKAEIGVYTWQCTYTLMNDPITKFGKGNVTLVR